MFNFSFRSKIEENVSVLKQKESTSYWEHEILQESIKTSKHSVNYSFFLTFLDYNTR